MQTLHPNDITLELASLKTRKNTRILNDLGQESFGTFPANKHNFPAGEIYLKLGVIGFTEARKGAFGLRHIWEKHQSDLELKCIQDIPAFIEKVLSEGAEVIVDKSKSPDKPLIVESNSGLITLALETPKGLPPHYNIITAYNRKNHPGVVIATMGKQKNQV